MVSGEILNRFDYSQSVLDFLAELERIPWFENIGKDVSPTAHVEQIHEWQEWPGPEDSSLDEAGVWQQSLHDEIYSSARDKSTQLAELWNRIHTIVFRDAAPKVPYDPDQDAWHAPSVAVWDAAWAAGLIGLCIYLNRTIPTELQQQWAWFVQGHWPCGWRGEFPNGKLMIF